MAKAIKSPQNSSSAIRLLLSTRSNKEITDFSVLDLPDRAISLLYQKAVGQKSTFCLNCDEHLKIQLYHTKTAARSVDKTHRLPLNPASAGQELQLMVDLAAEGGAATFHVINNLSPAQKKQLKIGAGHETIFECPKCCGLVEVSISIFAEESAEKGGRKRRRSEEGSESFSSPPTKRQVTPKNRRTASPVEASDHESSDNKGKVRPFFCHKSLRITIFRLHLLNLLRSVQHTETIRSPLEWRSSRWKAFQVRPLPWKLPHATRPQQTPNSSKSLFGDLFLCPLLKSFSNKTRSLFTPKGTQSWSVDVTRSNFSR